MERVARLGEWKKCDPCDGTGLVTVGCPAAAYRWCRQCRGAGVVFEPHGEPPHFTGRGVCAPIFGPKR